jgi:hypothetical protein
MALILEIRDVRGHATWQRLDRFPITLGRAVSNDVIVDDPYADAVHARILLDDAGRLVIVDAGTTNGLIAGGSRANHPVELAAGTELRMGRTLLRVRAMDEALAPALLDSPGSAVDALVPERSYVLPSQGSPAQDAVEPPPTRWINWVTGTRAGRLSIIGATLTALALNTWWGNTEAASGMPVFSTLLAAGAILLLWSLIWATAARARDRRFQLLDHLAVASLVTLALLGYTIVDEWLTFLFPDTAILPFVSSAIFLGALAWGIAAHLAVPRVMTARKRWRAGFIVSGVLLLLIVTGSLLDEDEFTDVPVFAQQVKGVPVGLVPSSTTTEFLDVMREVKSRADEAATTAAGGR